MTRRESESGSRSTAPHSADWTVAPAAFDLVAAWCQEHLELQHSADVGKTFGALLRALGAIACQTPEPGTDPFDRWKELETRVDGLLTDLAIAHAESLDARRAPPIAGRRTKLFVYGTLKRGCVRAPALAGQRFLGEARTEPRYRLYDCGRYPALVVDESGRSIGGEVWEVDASCLARLDEIEGVAVNLYRRDTIRLLPPFDEDSVTSYFFQRSVSGLPDCGEEWRPPEREFS